MIRTRLIVGDANCCPVVVSAWTWGIQKLGFHCEPDDNVGVWSLGAYSISISQLSIDDVNDPAVILILRLIFVISAMHLIIFQSWSMLLKSRRVPSCIPDTESCRGWAVAAQFRQNGEATHDRGGSFGL